jgi:hypothetical protein
MEEFGGNVDDSFAINGTNPVYKFSILNNGSPVYSKVIEANGNTYEDIKGTQTQSVAGDVQISNAQNRSITVGLVFSTVAQGMSWVFDWAHGAGSGAWTFIADTVEYLVNRIDFRNR